MIIRVALKTTEGWLWIIVEVALKTMNKVGWL